MANYSDFRETRKLMKHTIKILKDCMKDLNKQEYLSLEELTLYKNYKSSKLLLQFDLQRLNSLIKYYNTHPDDR